MSMLDSQIKELREAAERLEGYQCGEISRMLREAADTIESLRGRLQNAGNVDAEHDAVFANALRRIVENNTNFGSLDSELSHIQADELLCDLLLLHGYIETVDVFQNMRKWYA